MKRLCSRSRWLLSRFPLGRRGRLGDRAAQLPPAGTSAGDTWKAELPVLQHGRHPARGRLARDPDQRRPGDCEGVPGPADRRARALPRRRQVPVERDVELGDLGRLLADAHVRARNDRLRRGRRLVPDRPGQGGVLVALGLAGLAVLALRRRRRRASRRSTLDLCRRSMTAISRFPHTPPLAASWTAAR